MKDLTLLDICNSPQELLNELHAYMMANPDKTILDISRESGLGVEVINRFAFKGGIMHRRSLIKLYNYLKSLDLPDQIKLHNYARSCEYMKKVGK